VHCFQLPTGNRNFQSKLRIHAFWPRAAAKKLTRFDFKREKHPVFLEHANWLEVSKSAFDNFRIFEFGRGRIVIVFAVPAGKLGLVVKKASSILL